MTDIHHPENDSQYAWLTMNNNVAYPLNVNPSMHRAHLRAGAHGISSGVFSIINGGSFGSGFVAGAVSSSIGSITQSISKNPCVMTLSSAAAGGITAWATGGSFLWNHWLFGR